MIFKFEAEKCMPQKNGHPLNTDTHSQEKVKILDKIKMTFSNTIYNFYTSCLKISQQKSESAHGIVGLLEPREPKFKKRYQ